VSGKEATGKDGGKEDADEKEQLIQEEDEYGCLLVYRRGPKRMRLPKRRASGRCRYTSRSFSSTTTA